jgi:hypothetical protein
MSRSLVRISCFWAFLAGIFLMFAYTADAALLYLDPADADLYRGDTLTIALRLDTDEGECINTIDAIVEYDETIRAVDVSRGDSILNIWIEDPKIDENTHTITFAGGVPGGYCGRIAGDPSLTNIIAELVFRSPGLNIGGGTAQSAGVRVGGASQVLLHDGFGTRADLRTIDATVTLHNSAGQGVEDEWLARIGDDTTPPAPFSITLARDDNAFSGKYFITFNTQDKQSGIDHYEVMEEPFEEFSLFKWGAADAPWRIAESPYVLMDQSLNSTIRVRAIDKAGLETVAVLVPDEAVRTFSLARLGTLAIVGVTCVIVVLLIGYALWRRKQQLIKDFEDKHEV